MTDRDDFSELISAFLDGEVTPEEKVMIEERLVDNVADRRLFEEMRSIREGLKSLPRHELGKDLSQSILRSAERAMLSAEPAELSQPQDQWTALQEESQGREAANAATRPRPPQQANWRTLVLAGLTVAAAVLIIVVANWPQWERPVALNPSDAGSAEVASAPSAPMAADLADVVEAKMADEAGAVAPPAPANGIRESKMARFGVAEEAETASGLALEQKAGSDFQDDSLHEGLAGNRTASGGRGAGMLEEDSGVPELRTHRLTELAKAKEAADGAVDEVFAQTATEELDAIEIRTDRLLVVSLNVSPDAVRTHSLDNALVRNSVSFEYAAEQIPAIRDAFAKGLQQDRAEKGQIASRGALRELDARDHQLAMAGNGDVMLFASGSEEQVRAALKEVLEQRDEFQLAGVHAAPPASALQQFAEQHGGTEHWNGAAPAAPGGPGAPSDADAPADLLAAADAEGEEFAGTAEEKTRRAPRVDAETPPADTPAAAPASVATLADEPAEEHGAPAESERRSAAAESDDDAVVLPPELKPSQPSGVVRKPAEWSAKKSALNKDAAEENSEEEKESQAKAEGGGAPARAFDHKRDGQESDRQQVTGTDVARRKNRPDGRSSGDRSGSEAGQPVEETEPAKTAGYRGTGSAVAGRPTRQVGGFGGGGAAGKLPLPNDAFGDGKSDRYARQMGRKRLAAAAQSAPAPQVVQVLFVLRTVAPPAGGTAGSAKIAVDAPPNQQPPAAARVRQVETGAEAVEAAEAVIEPAEPAVRD